MSSHREEIVNCPVCGSDRYVFQFSNPDYLTGMDFIYSMVKCSECGLLYVNPRPTPESLLRFYPDHYPAYEKNIPDKVFSFRNSFLKTYLGLRKYHLFKWLWKNIISPIRICNEIDPSLVYLSSDSQVLDIGCANGLFLDHIRWLTNCKIHGIEINDRARVLANQRFGNDQVVLASLESARFPEHSYDLVTMWLVIEHLADVPVILKKINYFLKRSGVLVIATPNADSWERYLFNKKWAAYDIPRHLQIFSPQTIRRLLEDNGYKINKIKYDFSCNALLSSLEILLFGERSCQGKSKQVPDLNNMFLLKTLALPFTLIEAFCRKSSLITIYASKTDKIF